MAEQIQEWVVDEPYLHHPALLGEGPHYNPSTNTLRFLDINSNKLHTLDLNKGPSSFRTIDTHIPIGVTADIAGEDSSKVILTGSKDGVTKFYLDEEGREDKKAKANDGNVDPKGRFWVEAFVTPEIEEPNDREGVLWRMQGGNGTWSLKEAMTNMTIPNGISWTADRKWMYVTDSPVQRVYRFPWNEETGEVDVSDRESKIWYQESEEGMFPDGHVMDVEGNIWQAFYGGSQVKRISPTGEGGSKGRVTGVVRLPTKNITCPVFVGTELFMTSAKDKSGSGDEKSEKYGGSLFRVDVGVEGMKKPEAVLD
ncbi:uncharacterized protein AB675_665 [Cyphellophora attinorum]|uniref:SMP-30/Gluconolactonase/LRE-like region domain-containing protein n=1 Tax=Cyphellophora attinorum TaxID=1664694 RepID=A0A0N1HI46_9EURO|nr:uncharacterized protein AB675_665 [Phialophora attinorum]KPI45882.1 hypothetical protein AB675_665 [Phialophora attinorum]